MMQTPEIKTNDQGVKTLVEAITKPIQKAIKKRQDNFKNQSAVAQSKEIMKASGKQQRKTIKEKSKADIKMVKAVRKQANKLEAKSGTKVTMSTPLSSASFTRNSVVTPAKSKSTTPRRTTTTPKAAPKTATSSAKITKASATNTKPKIPAASVKARKMK